MQLNFGRERGKFGPKHFPGFFQHHIAAAAGGYPAKNQQAINLVKIRLERNCITKINADGFVN